MHGSMCTWMTACLAVYTVFRFVCSVFLPQGNVRRCQLFASIVHAARWAYSHYQCQVTKEMDNLISCCAGDRLDSVGYKSTLTLRRYTLWQVQLQLQVSVIFNAVSRYHTVLISRIFGVAHIVPRETCWALSLGFDAHDWLPCIWH